MKRSPTNSWFVIPLYGILTLYGLITLMPFLWAISASFKPLAEIVSGEINLIPRQFTFENYQQLLLREPLFGRWLLNSVVIAISVTGCNLPSTPWQDTPSPDCDSPENDSGFSWF
jgi:multiple sugar transport system permease protein